MSLRSLRFQENDGSYKWIGARVKVPRTKRLSRGLPVYKAYREWGEASQSIKKLLSPVTSPPRGVRFVQYKQDWYGVSVKEGS